MVLKYTNTIDEFVEMQCFLDKIKKGRIFQIKVFSIILFACYMGSIAYIVWILSEMNKRSFSYEAIEIGSACIGAAIVAIMLTTIVVKLRPKIYLYQIRRAYKHAIKKKPNIIMERQLIIESNKFISMVDKSQNEFYFEEIYKVFENNDKIYIFDKNYKKVLLIPEKVFRDNDEKLDFLRRIKNNKTVSSRIARNRV